MSETPQKFVLRGTFKKDSPGKSTSSVKTVFGAKWFFCTEHREKHISIHLHRAAVDEHDKFTPISLKFSISLETGNNIVEKSTFYTFHRAERWGWQQFHTWNDEESEDDEITVEVQAELVKVFKNPEVSREFVLRQKIEDFPDLTNNWSAVETHYGIPWCLSSKHFNDKFTVQLHCKKETRSNLWGIDVKYQISFHKSSETCEKSTAFSYSQNSTRGFTVSFDWNDVIEKFKVNNEVTVEARVMIYEIYPEIKEKTKNFEEDDGELTDVCLVVDEKKFFVNKAIISNFSSVFKAMFFSGFVEKNSKTVVIEDVNKEVFEEFLKIIYSEKPDITGRNVGNLMNLADRYDVPRVTRKCLKFLLNSDEVDVKKKLELADQFELVDLQEQALDSLKSAKDVKALQEKMRGTLSCTMATALLDKALSFIA